MTKVAGFADEARQSTNQSTTNQSIHLDDAQLNESCRRVCVVRHCAITDRRSCDWCDAEGPPSRMEEHLQHGRGAAPDPHCQRRHREGH